MIKNILKKLQDFLIQTYLMTFQEDYTIEYRPYGLAKL
jgi:hypothetical protein